MIPLPKPHIKPQIVCHCTHDEIIQALSLFLYSMRQKAGEEPGNEANGHHAHQHE